MTASADQTLAPPAASAEPADRRRVIAWDVLSTLLATGLVAGANILTYRLAADQFGPVGFGEYALVRRTLSVALPAVMFGVGIALPRYIAAHTQTRLSEHDRGALDYLAAAWSIVIGSLLTVILVGALIPGPFAKLFFGASHYESLLPVVAGSLGSLCVQAVVYSYLRGRLRIRAANIYLVVSNGAFPLAAFVVGRGSVVAVLWWNAVFTYGFAGVYLLRVFVREGSFFHTKRRQLGDLLRYGVPRVPGDFALAAVISFPSIVAAHVADVTTAGVVAFGTSLVTLVGTAMSPLSTVLLPHAVVLAREGKLSLLRSGLTKAFPIFLVGGVGSAIALELLAPWIVRHFLGASYTSDVASVRWMLGGVVPYSAFIAVRSLNDALYERAVNAISSYAALAICIAIAGALLVTGHRPRAAEIGFVAGMWVLAILTCIRARAAIWRATASD
jgi:O-antigen/teichoic acid export membrane protein